MCARGGEVGVQLYCNTYYIFYYFITIRIIIKLPYLFWIHYSPGAAEAEKPTGQCIRESSNLLRLDFLFVQMLHMYNVQEMHTDLIILDSSFAVTELCQDCSIEITPTVQYRVLCHAKREMRSFEYAYNYLQINI